MKPLAHSDGLEGFSLSILGMKWKNQVNVMPHIIDMGKKRNMKLNLVSVD